MPFSDNRGAAVVKNMADRDGVRAALLKTGFEFQTENPQDDLQIKRLVSRMTASKRNITLDVKKAETTAENVIKLKFLPIAFQNLVIFLVYLTVFACVPRIDKLHFLTKRRRVGCHVEML